MKTTSINGTSLYVGRNSGASTVNKNGDPNTFVGSFTGFSNVDGGGNTFVGYGAGYNNLASANTFVGLKAGYNVTTGWFNTFTGGMTGFYTTTGKGNVFTGYWAGQGTTTGAYNIFMGYGAGYRNQTGSQNIFLGYWADSSTPSGNSNNNIYLGSFGANESNTMRLGSPLYQSPCVAQPCGISATYIAGVYGATINSGKLVCIDSTGKLGTSCTIGLAAQEDTIRSQAQRIEDLELRLSRLEALLTK